MVRVSLLKQLRVIYEQTRKGAAKTALGELISDVNKPKRAAIEEQLTRKQLIVSAHALIQKINGADTCTEDERRAVTIIQQFMDDEINFVVDRDTKKQVSQIVKGQVANIVRLHPDYFTEKGLKGVFRDSLTKRLTGDIYAYMRRMAMVSSPRVEDDGTAK